MHYKFPVIETIDDVLPAIEGAPEFIVAERNGHTIINYNVAFADTFPVVTDRKSALRRECRGIIFDSDGKLIRRPYHKFKNVNESEDTQAHLVDLSREHHVLDKLDGSMLVPFVLNDKLEWGTKMGLTEVAAPVAEFAANNPMYNNFALMLIRAGYTPIFEWCSRKQRIVIDHPEDMLILTAIRDMRTGEYVHYDDIKAIAQEALIPVVAAFDSLG